MDILNFNQYAHLYLGLTKQELFRRYKLGEIDPQILLAQLNQNAAEVKLEALSEKWIEANHLEQVDKYDTTE